MSFHWEYIDKLISCRHVRLKSVWLIFLRDISFSHVDNITAAINRKNHPNEAFPTRVIFQSDTCWSLTHAPRRPMPPRTPPPKKNKKQEHRALLHFTVSGSVFILTQGTNPAQG